MQSVEAYFTHSVLLPVGVGGAMHPIDLVFQDQVMVPINESQLDGDFSDIIEPPAEGVEVPLDGVGGAVEVKDVLADGSGEPPAEGVHVSEAVEGIAGAAEGVDVPLDGADGAVEVKDVLVDGSGEPSEGVHVSEAVEGNAGAAEGVHALIEAVDGDVGNLRLFRPWVAVDPPAHPPSLFRPWEGKRARSSERDIPPKRMRVGDEKNEEEEDVYDLPNLVSRSQPRDGDEKDEDEEDDYGLPNLVSRSRPRDRVTTPAGTYRPRTRKIWRFNKLIPHPPPAKLSVKRRAPCSTPSSAKPDRTPCSTPPPSPPTQHQPTTTPSSPPTQHRSTTTTNNQSGTGRRSAFNGVIK